MNNKEYFEKCKSKQFRNEILFYIKGHKKHKKRVFCAKILRDIRIYGYPYEKDEVVINRKELKYLLDYCSDENEFFGKKLEIY